MLFEKKETTSSLMEKFIGEKINDTLESWYVENNNKDSKGNGLPNRDMFAPMRKYDSY